MTATDNTDFLHIDPVNLVADQHSVYFMGQGSLDLSEDEAAGLAADVSFLFEPWGGVITVNSTYHWTIALSQPLIIPNLPPVDLVGKNISALLDLKSCDPGFLRLFTEIQMCLSQHPVNIQRREAGEAEVNALWLWREVASPSVTTLKAPWWRWW